MEDRAIQIAAIYRQLMKLATAKRCLNHVLPPILVLRFHPNTTSPVLGTLRKGEEVEVIDKENGFAAIEFNGERGYASLKYLNKIY